MRSEAEKRNKKYWIAIAIVSLLIVSALSTGWFFAFRTSFASAKLNSESYYLNQESDKKTEIVQKYNRVASFQPFVNDTLPTEKAISSFLADVQNLSDKNKIKINSSMIGTSQKAKSGNLLYSQTISQKDYYELQIKYEMEGSYQNFLDLLNDLKTIRRLNNISNLSIIKLSADTTNDVVTATFVDSIYIKK